MKSIPSQGVDFFSKLFYRHLIDIITKIEIKIKASSYESFLRDVSI